MTVGSPNIWNDDTELPHGTVGDDLDGCRLSKHTLEIGSCDYAIRCGLCWSSQADSLEIEMTWRTYWHLKEGALKSEW
jgi:hypothetical protein